MAGRAAEIDLGHGPVVSGLLPIRSEADLRPLMAALADRGARLALPVVLDRETIVFRALVRGAEMVSTGFGTSGPGPDAAVLDPDVMLVPLAAFDRRGHRLGYGAGHYDRAIARLHERGVYFRSLHLGNVVQTPQGELGLIDIADMKTQRRALGRTQRKRNFAHMLRYAEDRQWLLADEGGELSEGYLRHGTVRWDARELRGILNAG